MTEPVRTTSHAPRPSVVIAVVVVLAALVAFVAALGLGGDEDKQPATSSTLPPTTVEDSTTVPSSTTAPVVDTSTAVWPGTTDTVRYRDPVEAARGFAVAFGMRAPVVGEFIAGDGRSGEVEIRAKAGLAPTTVFVRQLSGSNDWWVLGAATADVEVTAPETGATVSSPLALTGRAWAFEGHVNVEIREDGNTRPLGTSYVIGRGDELGPFTGSISFARPTQTHGALVFTTDSAEDGSVISLSVLRVRFGTVTAEQACAGPARAAQPGERLVKVFFTCVRDGEPAGPVAVTRAVVDQPAVLRHTLEALLVGPSSQERASGLTSWFSGQTAGLLRGVTIDEAGAATVDFENLAAVIPNASSSAGSAMLLGELDATVFQFPTVQTVTYTINGSCEAFYEWLQLGCGARLRPSR